MDKNNITDNINKKQKVKREIISWIWVIAAVIIIRVFFVQAFKIPSTSMVPTLKVGDHLLANKIIYKIRSPERGDVVIFKYPKNPSIDFVKRLIGLPGETVFINNGHVYINGIKLKGPDSITKRYYYSIGTYGVDAPFLVPKDSYFMLGDNSFVSKDSRFFGVVPKKDIIGEAWFIYWPPWRMGIIH